VIRGDVQAPALESAARDGHAQVFEMQRARLLGGAVAAVEKLGWSNVTVASISSRARVSRRTFYELFSDREDCLLAVLHETSAWIAAELAGAKLDDLPWRERVRKGLWIVLSFFDREPELARLCVSGSARGGAPVLAWREEILERLIAIVDEGRLQNERAAKVPPLTAEGTVGAVLAILQRRLLDPEEEPVSALLNPLVASIVLPYLGHVKAANELGRSEPGEANFSGRPDPAVLKMSRLARPGDDPLKDIPMRLTYRTARVLNAVAQYPGASNRLIGEHADVHDQGQVSKLLARLKRLGLLANTGNGQAKGEPNAWRLTELGERVTRQLALNTDVQKDGAA
jgi:AcrR family transcriptional regulator/DNA-binding MarR family transcriptional regulator